MKVGNLERLRIEAWRIPYSLRNSQLEIQINYSYECVGVISVKMRNLKMIKQVITMLHNRIEVE